MKNLLRKIGKVFVILWQEEEKDIRQNILIAEGNFILLNNFALIIKGVKNRFRNAKINVLTFKDKEVFIRENFPDVEVIIPENSNKRFRLALRMASLLKRKFDFVVLSSLTSSLAAISLLSGKRKIFLHNRWFEWYRIRQRTFMDIIRGAKSADKNRRKKNSGLKDVLKTIGRIFVILSEMSECDIESRILIADNGYTEVGHIIRAIERTEALFINPYITLLTFDKRRHHFESMLPRIELVVRMPKKPRKRFTHIVLTDLNIARILRYMLLTGAKVVLYNKWHQWWGLRFRSPGEYLKKILRFLARIPIFIYLLIISGFILLRTNLRICLINLNGRNRAK